MDGWMDGWMDGERDREIVINICRHLCRYRYTDLYLQTDRYRYLYMHKKFMYKQNIYS